MGVISDWEVIAPLATESVFVVSYDTSGISGMGEAVAARVAESRVGDSKREAITQLSGTKLFESAVEHRKLPRYYLKVTRQA
jgi:hypothetical protein